MSMSEHESPIKVRIYEHQEVLDVLAALHGVKDALPRPFRWLLRTWASALAVLGNTLTQELESRMVQHSVCDGFDLWTQEDLRTRILSLSSVRSERMWHHALASVLVALGLAPIDIGDHIQAWLDNPSPHP